MHIFREHEIQKKVLFIEYIINIFIVYFIINQNMIQCKMQDICIEGKDKDINFHSLFYTIYVQEMLNHLMCKCVFVWCLG